MATPQWRPLLQETQPCQLKPLGAHPLRTDHRQGSRDRGLHTKWVAPEPRSRGCTSKTSKATQQAESCLQRALDREFEKVQREAARRALDTAPLEHGCPHPFADVQESYLSPQQRRSFLPRPYLIIQRNLEFSLIFPQAEMYRWAIEAPL